MLGMGQTAYGLQMDLKMDSKPQLILDNMCWSIWSCRVYQRLRRLRLSRMGTRTYTLDVPRQSSNAAISTLSTFEYPLAHFWKINFQCEQTEAFTCPPFQSLEHCLILLDVESQPR